MKIRNPQSRDHLIIKKSDRVLDIGGGHNPHSRANVVVDKFVDSNFHRCGDIKIYKNQEFICSDGDSLPFKDHSFDYTICCHVLEHVDDPVKFLSEQSRVAPKGYLETPSILGEYLMPKESHRWILQEIDNKIVMYEKNKIGFNAFQNFGYVFLDYLPKNSIGYKLMERTHPCLTNMKYEWEKNIEVIVNPDSSYYKDFFTKPWEKEICDKLMIKRSLDKEARSTFIAFLDVCKSVFKSHVLKRN